MIASIKYRIKSAKTQEMMKQQIQFYTNLVEMMHQNNFQFNLWTVFEDDTKLIFSRLQEEIEKYHEEVINSKEDRDVKGVSR